MLKYQERGTRFTLAMLTLLVVAACSDGSTEPGSDRGPQRGPQDDDEPSRAFCWGDNTRGQIGDGTRNPALVPTQVMF